MENITRFKALCEVEGTNGKIFTAVFTKKDGTERTMNCRIGVEKDVKGVQAKSVTANQKRKGLFPVYDVKAEGWRTINFYTLSKLKINRKEYSVKD